eukprot:41504-Rhodomonas_salina.2
MTFSAFAGSKLYIKRFKITHLAIMACGLHTRTHFYPPPHKYPNSSKGILHSPPVIYKTNLPPPP